MIDPFSPTYTPTPFPSESPRKAVTLFELNSMASAVLRHSMPESVWLTAEISELRVASNGHCYLEFVQKDELSGSLVAKARGNIWRNSYIALSGHFERQTGQRLTAGIKVLVAVSVTFHELYGYSLNVTDIDPAYTLGDLARRRKEIIRQLEEDGVMDLNKELPLPRVIRNVAIISSATAAGYGDFCKQLEQSGYAFEKKLFPATMQGEKVEPSVIAALDQIAAETADWDVVVIIRGGGATTDLGGFDSYLLAANIAQFPLPVLTGIGHERDDTIIDLVAHKRLKTPTAVAAFLIDSRTNETSALNELTQRLARAAARQLQEHTSHFDDLSQRLHFSAHNALTARRQKFDALSHRYSMAASHYTARQRERLLRMEGRLGVLSQSIILKERNRTANLPALLQRSLENILTNQRHRLEKMEQAVKMNDPKRILSLGYSITLKDGRPVGDASQVQPGDRITTRFANGEVQSKVLNKE